MITVQMNNIDPDVAEAPAAEASEAPEVTEAPESKPAKKKAPAKKPAKKAKKAGKKAGEKAPKKKAPKKKVPAKKAKAAKPRAKKTVKNPGMGRGAPGLPRRAPRTNPPSSKELAAYGGKVVSARKKLGLTQRDFAKKIGYSQPGVCNIERGISGPGEKVAEKILKVAGVKPPKKKAAK